jgi:hypothetical protein
MKLTRLLACGLLAAALFAPAIARSQTLLSQNASQRAEIMDIQYLLSLGVPASVAADLQSRVVQIQQQINGTGPNDPPGLQVPAYGSCDANQTAILYLQDELANSNINYQQRVINERAIHDLQVNSSRRGC